MVMLPVVSAAKAAKTTQLHATQRHTRTAKTFLIAFIFLTPLHFIFFEIIESELIVAPPFTEMIYVNACGYCNKH